MHTVYKVKGDSLCNYRGRGPERLLCDYVPVQRHYDSVDHAVCISPVRLFLTTKFE